MRCGLTGQSNGARSLRVEDDDGRTERHLLVGSMGSRVVELVEDVRVDAPGAPFAVDRLGGTPFLDGHVVGMDLGTNAVEEDPTLATDPRHGPRSKAGTTADQQLGHRFDDRASELRANLLAAIGHGEGGGQDGLAAGALRSLGRRGRSEEAREHRSPGALVGGHPVHHRASENPLVVGGVREERGNPGNERVGLDPGVDHGAGVRRCVLEPHRRIVCGRE